MDGHDERTVRKRMAWKTATRKINDSKKLWETERKENGVENGRQRTAKPSSIPEPL